MDAMMKRLQSIEERYNEINEEMMSPEIVSDPKTAGEAGQGTGFAETIRGGLRGIKGPEFAYRAGGGNGEGT